VHTLFLMAIFAITLLTAFQSFAAEAIDFRVSANVHQNVWKPSDDDDGNPDSEDPFDYETENIFIWGTQLQSFVNGSELFRIAKNGSLKPSEHRDELISKNESSQRTLDSLDVGISPFLLLAVNPTLRNLRLDYRRDYFTGSATTEVDGVLYLSQNVNTAFSSKGQSVTIASDFKEWELTVKGASNMRYGAYKTLTLKPMSSAYYTADTPSLTVVADMEISAIGFVLLQETSSSRFDVKLGQVQFHARQSYVDSAAFDSSGLDFVVSAYWFPNLLDSVKGMSLSPLIGGQFRMQFTSGGDEDKAAPLIRDGSSGDFNLEFLFDFGLMFSYQW